MGGEGMLRRRERIARRAAHDLVLTMAKNGDHGHPRFRLEADVKRFFAERGAAFEEVVERSRDYRQHVPFFENLLGGGHVFVNAPGGGSVAWVDLSSGEEKEVARVEGTGVLVTSSYQQHFVTALKALERAVVEGSWGEFLSAVSGGLASVEAYVNYRAGERNKTHPSDLLVDSKQSKVSFELKIEQWVPRMAGGRKLDRSDAVWRDFLALRAIRDDQAIHTKNASSGVTYQQMAEAINRFRSGIAMFLVRLHGLFSEPIPSQIIRAASAPDVEATEPPPSVTPAPRVVPCTGRRGDEMQAIATCRPLSRSGAGGGDERREASPRAWRERGACRGARLAASRGRARRVTARPSFCVLSRRCVLQEAQFGALFEGAPLLSGLGIDLDEPRFLQGGEHGSLYRLASMEVCLVRSDEFEHLLDGHPIVAAEAILEELLQWRVIDSAEGQLTVVCAAEGEVAERGHLPQSLLHDVRSLPVLAGKEEGVEESALLVEVEADHLLGAGLPELRLVETEEEVLLVGALEIDAGAPVLCAVELGEGLLELGRRFEAVDELVHEGDVDLGFAAGQQAADECHGRPGDAEGVQHHEGGSQA
jgi:hypothetical protein